MKSICTVIMLVLLCLSSAAMADVILTATSSDMGNGDIYDGYLRARSEADMSVNVAYEVQYSNELLPLWPTVLTMGTGGKYIAGDCHGRVMGGRAWDVRTVWPAGTKYTYAVYSGITAIATRPNGDVVVGTMHDWYPNVPEEEATAWWPGRVLVLDPNDLTKIAADYNSLSSPDSTGHFYVGAPGPENHTDVTALATLTNGYVVIGDSNGIVYLRAGTDLYSSQYVPDTINFGAGVRVNAIAVVPFEPNNLIVIADGNNGHVTVRIPDDSNLAVSVSDVNLGSPVVAMVTLPNNRVAIGLANGQVTVRDPNTNIATDLGINTTFDSNIMAMAVTSSGHVVIGTKKPRVYIRSGDNLNVIPAGVGFGPEGYLQLRSSEDANYVRISALAAYSPGVPTTCLEARHGGHMLYGDYNGDCYVNLKDVARLALKWQARCGYNYLGLCQCGDPAVNGGYINIVGDDLDGVVNKSWSGYVKFNDFAVFLEDWLRCTDPLNANCEHTWE
jgi:hypothetical protein